MYFDYGSVELSAQARSKVREAASVAQGARVGLTGHTDTAGDAQANLLLSKRRAEAVKRALVESGLDSERIRTFGRGSEQLMIRTAQGVREPQNRRVEFAIVSPHDTLGASREEPRRCSVADRR